MLEAKRLQPEASQGLDGLYQRYSAWFDQRMRARLGSDRAEEVVQETWLRMTARGIDDVRHPKSFLLRIAMNIVRNDARDVRVRMERSGLLPPAQDDAAVQHDVVLLSQIIRSMPQLYRDVFVLSRFGGMAYEEIARRLGISVKVVEWRMSRALEHCASRLEL